uniref:Coiled-coil domain containing 120a n=1 Tax=Sparus aurata TaxID=8175 RepID=A0A671XIE3_SPAAU
ESSSEEGGDPLTCPDRKRRERMAELQERRRGLQALLSTRLAELRCVCLQEAELTGAVPSDYPLEAGERPPCVRRRGGTSRQGNRKCRAERSKPKKTLFSGALRKHSDSEHNTHTQTHTHHGKRTVHRGCHTGNTHAHACTHTHTHTHDGVSQCRPPLVSAGSPVEVLYQNKTRKNSLHNRPLPLPPSQPPTNPLHPPPPPPRSQDSSFSSGPSDPSAAEGGVRVNGARHSHSSDALLDHINPPEEEGGLWVNGLLGSRGKNTAGAFMSSETLTDGRTRMNNAVSEGGGAGRGRGGGYSEVLLDYVWGKQQQLQRQQSQTNNRKPITSQHQLLYNGLSLQQPLGAPPTCRGHPGDQRRIKVTRTKSCGPFLPVQQSQTDTHNPPLSAIQPDPHPHLLPPRPPHLPPTQDAQLEEATRSLHKALALEGLRDWYLRNTIGSTHQNQAIQTGGGGALQGRRRTTVVIQTETSHHHAPPQHKQTLPHSATFHGHPLHGRSVDSSLHHDSFPPHKQEVPLRDLTLDQPSPGTLV